MRRLAFALLLLSSPALAAAAATIYRCEQAGVTTFSDQPCDASATPYELSGPVNTYTAAPAQPATAPARPRRPVQRQPQQKSDQEARRKECSRINTGLKDIRSRMRAGYGVKEGERLRARQHKLEQQRRERRC